jgi:5-(carboxyamino)imidazole ribonucleotide synthase
VRPGWRVLHVAQDRLREKRFLNGSVPDPLVRTTAFHEAGSFAEFRDAVYAFDCDAIVKTTRFGYDGKGQVRVTASTDLAEVWQSFGGQTAIVEAFVPFEREISVIVARGLDGGMACFDPVENEHRNHILLHTHAPAPIDSALAADARLIAETIAVALDLTGLLAVEMFVSHEGEILVNELAPRPHNSGHWTIDACVTSQFEQFVRAICGLPLGSPERHHDAQMTNLLGPAVDDWPQILADPHARLHLYGKSDARPGRKMGHVTRLKPLRRDG